MYNNIQHHKLQMVTWQIVIKCCQEHAGHAVLSQFHQLSPTETQPFFHSTIHKTSEAEWVPIN